MELGASRTCPDRSSPLPASKTALGACTSPVRIHMSRPPSHDMSCGRIACPHNALVCGLLGIATAAPRQLAGREAARGCSTPSSLPGPSAVATAWTTRRLRAPWSTLRKRRHRSSRLPCRRMSAHSPYARRRFCSLAFRRLSCHARITFRSSRVFSAWS